MSAEELSLAVVEILNQHAVPYMLVGSLSTNFHATVRSTKDADIVIQTSIADAARLIAAECPALRVDQQHGLKTISATSRVVLHGRAEDFAVELFSLSDDPHDQMRFSRRTCVDWLGRPTWIATAEDALVTKLR